MSVRSFLSLLVPLFSVAMVVFVFLAASSNSSPELPPLEGSAALAAAHLGERVGTTEPLPSTKRYRMRIETETLPTLLPHAHDLSADSVTDHGHGITLSSEVVVVPEDLWVTRFHTIVRNAPYATLHHSGLWRLDQPHAICSFNPDVPYARHIYVAANDVAQTPVEFPDPYGFFLPKGTPLLFQVMLHNPVPPVGPGGTYNDVFAEVIMETEKPADTMRTKPVDFFQLALEDVSCDPYNSVFTVPAQSGVYTKTSAVSDPKDNAHYVFDEEGTIVALGSHLHAWEYGKKVDVFLNGEPFVTLPSHRTSPDAWSWFSPRIYSFTHVHKGDTIAISATYDNPLDRPIRGAMGMIGFYFSPGDTGLVPDETPAVAR